MAVTTTYENIAMVVGIEAAQMLVAQYGGTELYIPSLDNLKPDHKLVTLLGIDAAQRLCRYWSSQVLNIPLNKRAQIADRNAKIIAQAKQGECPNKLATQFALHVRTIRKIIEKDIKDKANAVYARNQFSLFD